jgi:hypothetical protein
MTASGYTGVDPNALASLGRVWRSGSRYSPSATAIGSAVQITNEARFTPIAIPNACTLTEIAAELVTIGSSGSTTRLFIANDVGGRPGAILFCSAALDTFGAAPGKISSAMSLSVVPGRYYVGALEQGSATAATLRTISGVPEMIEQPVTPAFYRCCYSSYGNAATLTVPGTLSMDSANAARVEVLVA